VRIDSLEMAPAVFSILSGLIEEQSGLHYGLLDRDILREKSSARAVEAGFESLLDYYYYLRYDSGGPTELTELIDSLVVNETYFFREWPAIKVIVDSFLAPLCEAGVKPRIWSAACATGEEPLSLAMLLASRGLLEKVEIVASDISTRALSRAREGKFGRRSVRAVPEPALLERFISGTPEGYTVDPAIARAIHWERHNLLIEEDYARFGRFDVILCRNVLIYFSDPTIQRVLASFDRILKPDGLLAVGVSESLLRYGRTFLGEERSGSFVYRKAGTQ
jgi:chemotaxis protein methyltransferase CheR